MLARILVLLAACFGALHAAPPSDWKAVERLAPGTRVQALPMDRKAPEVKGTVVRASADSLTVLSKTGETSLVRAAVKRVQIADPGRRTRNGLIAMGVGAAVGAVAGELVCLYCRNEGHTGFAPYGLAAGAGLGALGFLGTPYRTVYQAARK